MIGIDDLDDDVLERLDLQETKMNKIENMLKRNQTLMARNETDIKRKMMQNLADVNTLKEEIQQIVKIQKRNMVNTNIFNVSKLVFF